MGLSRLDPWFDEKKLKREIKKGMADQDIRSVNELAHRCGISQSTMWRKYLSGQFTYSELRRIFRELRFKPEKIGELMT